MPSPNKRAAESDEASTLYTIEETQPVGVCRDNGDDGRNCRSYHHGREGEEKSGGAEKGSRGARCTTDQVFRERLSATREGRTM